LKNCFCLTYVYKYLIYLMCGEKKGFLLIWKKSIKHENPSNLPPCYRIVGAYKSCNVFIINFAFNNFKNFNNSPRNALIYKWIEELSSNNDLMQVLFICCAVLVNKSGLSLSWKIRHVFSNMSLFLKKSYNQRGHLCYMHICLRLTSTYHHS
jgi:hypothetical protein